jgi:hypothetical protein
MNTSHEHLYYLDPWFIAREYECQKNQSLPSKIRRSSSSGIQGSVGLLKGQGGSQETVEFEQTPEKAFWEICHQLFEFPNITIGQREKFPPLFWISGVLAPLGETHSKCETGKPDQLIDDVWSFSIESPASSGTHVRLLAEETYFRYNIFQLLAHPTTLGSHFRPRVRALLKSHGDTNEGDFYLATPLVIIEVSEDKKAGGH